jgi:hypothetical protein
MAMSARLLLVPPPVTAEVQVVVIQLLEADAAAAVQLPAVGPEVTVLQVVAVQLLAAEAVSAVQDATGVAARMVVVAQLVVV